MWKLPPHDREHLQSIHARHVQIRYQEREGLGLEQGNRARSRGRRVYLRLTRQFAHHLSVKLQQILVVIQEEYLVSAGHRNLPKRLVEIKQLDARLQALDFLLVAE
jgi:hypothetical protein